MASSNTYDISTQATVLAAAAISEGQTLVRNTSGAYAVAGLTDQPEVVALEDIASGEEGAVKYLSSADTFLGLASGAITEGAEVYQAASGALSTTQGTGAFRVGVAHEAKTDTDLFEVHYKPGYTAGS